MLLARSEDYQRPGLEPPEDCIKDREDTPELTYTTDGMVCVFSSHRGVDVGLILSNNPGTC